MDDHLDREESGGEALGGYLHAIEDLGRPAKCAYGLALSDRGEPMIKQIHIKNFKTLRDVTIPLAPKITVMVGANNSGKSNALAVLKLIGETARRENLDAAVDSAGGIEAITPRPRGGTFSLDVTGQFLSGTEIIYTLGPDVEEIKAPARSGRLTKEGNFSFGEDFLNGRRAGGNLTVAARFDPALLEFDELLSGISVFDLSVTALRAASTVQRNIRLGPDGQNAAAVLDALAGENPDLRDAIEAEVRKAAPDVKRLLTRLGNQPGTKVLGFEEKSGAVFGADEMSDGLVLFVGMSIATQLTAPRRSLIAIEEPERGIHPRRLRELLDQFIRVTQQGTQVVLTTHSPHLLDEFRDYPESILIFDRDEGGTHVTRLSDKPEWMEDLKGAPLGDIWYSGILGGVPKP